MYRAYYYTVSTPTLTGEGLTFTAFIQADSKVQAERLVRETPRFRKTLRQNGVDWMDAPLAVTRTSKIGKAR